ncbi:helix-turn-helix transcriptional regulator [Sphaerospermopsis sp. FACHB-1194]|nr:helix-turn-helix transcriptional regulator [Sphaerospermopsis sp. FACHB-1194]
MKNRVKEIRKNKNLTQEAIAEFCQVSIPTIKRLENNRSSRIQVSLLSPLCKILDCTLDQIFIANSD